MANGRNGARPKGKLELTWVGRENRPRLEPRILIEDRKLSYGDPNAGNMLIRGDNLLALEALEQDFAGKVKCIVDFIVETGTERFLIEVKARDELGDAEVKGKAYAAVKWCEAANQTQGGKRWGYAVIADDVVSETSSLAHLLAQAVKALSSGPA